MERMRKVKTEPRKRAGEGSQKEIRAHILDKVRAQTWIPGERIPSENELVKLFGASRMTVHHALRDLRNEGYLTRVKGVGTFVAPPRAHVVVTKLQDIESEIRERGNKYSVDLLTRELRSASLAEGALFDLGLRAKLLHVVLLHREDGVPVQVEDRLINVKRVPGVVDVDPLKESYFAYLMRELPYPGGRSLIRAIAPDALTRTRLQMPKDEPCLEIERVTWVEKKVVTSAKLSYPASRYVLTGDILPPNGA